MSDAPLPLFAGHGIEIEYMIVDAETLDVRPIADRLLERAAGHVVDEVEMGALAWSNELTLHLVELKTNGPAERLEALPAAFAADVRRIAGWLEPWGARLLPTSMHPWMDPEREMRLWPHANQTIYETYHRIFDCRGHGWANLQSTHLNLPFDTDEAFRRLQAALRLLLPLLPGLAASSPVAEGRPTGLLDTRLEHYRHHTARVPEMVGAVVPDPSPSRAAYEREVLGSIYAALAPHDAAGVLRHEWANARGAIARFDRHAIEVRLLDVQERPRADLAVCALVTAAAHALVAERWSGLEAQEAVPTAALADLLRTGLREAEATSVPLPALVGALGLGGGAAPTAAEVWRHLRQAAWPADDPREGAFGESLDLVLEQGPLARRLLRALGPAPSRAALREVYGRLADGLVADRPFDAPA